MVLYCLILLQQMDCADIIMCQCCMDPNNECCNSQEPLCDVSLLPSVNTLSLVPHSVQVEPYEEQQVLEVLWVQKFQMPSNFNEKELGPTSKNVE